MSTNLSAGRDVTSGADGTYMIINNGYSRGRRNQWGPELWRNAIQATERTVAKGKKLRGDERVEFDFLPLEFVDGAGQPLRGPVWKRRVWNDAEPMTEVELMDFFSSLAKGAGTNRFSKNKLDGQYGQGSRFSVLPHSGMFVGTTKPGGGTKAVFIYDNGGDKYSLANFTFPNVGIAADMADMSDDCYLDLGGDQYLWMIEDELIHPTVIKHGGVTTILMGPDLLDTYVEGDPARQESSRALVADLTRWCNGPLPVRVEYTLDTKRHSGSKTMAVGGLVKPYEGRVLKTYDDWFDRVPLGNQTTVNLTNPDGGVTELDVYLLPEDWNWRGPLSAAEQGAVKRKKGEDKGDLVTHNGSVYEVQKSKDAWLPWRGRGFITLAYDYEMIPVYDMKGDSKIVPFMKQWGITVPEVAERVALVIRPPKTTKVGDTEWGVQQTGSRGTLLGPDESPLPLDDWTNEFYDLLQSLVDLDFLRKALESAKPSTRRGIDPEDLKRLQQTLKGRMDLNPQDIDVTTKVDTGVPAEELDSEVETEPDHHSHTPIHKPGKGKRKRANPLGTPTPKTFAQTKKIPMMPDFEFLTEQEWQDKFRDDAVYAPDIFCVVERGVDTTMFFNTGHEIYVGQRTYYCTGPYFKESGSLDRMKRVKLVDLEQAVEDAYVTEAASKVFYADRMAKLPNGHTDLKRFREITEGEKMTLALAGLVNVDYAIKHRIGVLTR